MKTILKTTFWILRLIKLIKFIEVLNSKTTLLFKSILVLYVTYITDILATNNLVAIIEFTLMRS